MNSPRLGKTLFLGSPYLLSMLRRGDGHYAHCTRRPLFGFTIRLAARPTDAGSRERDEHGQLAHVEALSLGSPHTIMQAKKRRAEISKDVIGADESVFTRKHVNGFAQRPHIARPNLRGRMPNGEIEPRVAKTLAVGSQQE